MTGREPVGSAGPVRFLKHWVQQLCSTCLTKRVANKLKEGYFHTLALSFPLYKAFNETLSMALANVALKYFYHHRK